MLTKLVYMALKQNIGTCFVWLCYGDGIVACSKLYKQILICVFFFTKETIYNMTIFNSQRLYFIKYKFKDVQSCL